jgi:hypothetical protein
MSKLKTVTPAASDPNENPVVDRIAIKLFVSLDLYRPTMRRWKEIPGSQREFWRQHARTLLVIMSDSVTDKMCSAGVAAMKMNGAGDTRNNKTIAGDIFAAMMFEALED